jgi:hypothetical protein
MSNIVLNSMEKRTSQMDENTKAVAPVAVQPDRCGNEPHLMTVHPAPALEADMELGVGGGREEAIAVTRRVTILPSLTGGTK